MAVEVIMPKIDEDMKEGKIVDWVKHEGEMIKRGDTLFVIETEKVIWEVQAEGSGVLSKLMASVGAIVPVGRVVAYILKPGEKIPDDSGLPIEVGGQATAGNNHAMEKVVRTSEGVKASPLAKKIAKEYKIDIASIKGTGAGGRITERDVRKAIEAKGKKAEKTREILEAAEMFDLSPMRETIARRMTHSFSSVPHFYLSMNVDASEIINWRERLIEAIKKRMGVKLTITDLLIKIVGAALKLTPLMNVQWQKKKLLRMECINIGIAVATEKGLVVPVLRDVDKKGIAEITVDRSDLVERSRRGRLKGDEMRGGNITITNLGMFGVEQAMSIINPPESSILAVGSIIDRTVVVEKKICIKPMMNCTLSIDHRVVDGALGSRFLRTVKEFVEEPPEDLFTIKE
jgi:pyruvate dehydrogenase E2 component (dihydrolipoamide acetyltransferase)